MWLLLFPTLAVALSGVTAIDLSVLPALKDDKKPEKDRKHDTTCHDFSRGVTFNESQVLGNWHLLHYNVDHKDGVRTKTYCLQFAALTPEERTPLSEKVGKYVVNLKWENLSLKMTIPCEEVRSKSPHPSSEYFLERLDVDGSYRTLQMPPSAAKLDLSAFHRYQMRFKPIEDQYLAVMDCHAKLVFLLGRQLPQKTIDERLQNILHVYWPTQ